MPDELKTSENMTSDDTESLESDNQECEASQDVSENLPTVNYDTNVSYESEYDLKYISLDEIEPDKNQPRKDFSELDGLINSIENDGLIYPITVAQHPEITGKYVIVDGERRFRAYKELNERPSGDNENPFKYAKISARIISAFKQRVGIIANLMNKNYNCLEIADSLQRLLNEEREKDGKFTKKNLAEYLGKSQANISEYFSLLKLPEEIQDQERNNPCIPFNRLKQLASRKLEPQEMVDEYSKLLSEYDENGEEENNTDKKDTSSSPKPPFKEKKSHYSVLANKLESTRNALGKFKIEKISDDEMSELDAKLNAIIHDATMMKEKLKKGTNSKSA